MNKLFVALQDSLHAMLRKVTRHTPLRVRTGDTPYPVVEYAPDLDTLPSEYYTLAAYHSLAGLSLNVVLGGRWTVRPEERLGVAARVHYFDALKLDRRSARDLRIKLRREGAGMLSAELLAYGIGTLRARNDDLQDKLHQSMWRKYGRLSSRHEISYATIRALHWASQPSKERTRKESYDSTNVIYGDVLGEIQQLWDRRADISFLDQVARSLQALRGGLETGPSFHPPLNTPLILKLHKQCQAVWRRPPSGGRALLRRLDYLMENLVVDDNPTVAHHLGEMVGQQQKAPSRRQRSSGPDRSGYDGWLTPEF